MRARAPLRMVPLLILVLLPATFASKVSSARAPLVAGRPGPASAGTGPVNNPCKESAYTFDGSKWHRTFRWSFSAGTRPSGLRAKAVELALRRAASNVARSRNSCGLTDHVGATQAYQGRTRARPDIRDDSTCGKPDGRSVVGFGKLVASELALTCFWTRNGRTVEADIKLNRSDYHWYVKKPSTCANKWSIAAVATHEFGHAFGLNHVSEVTDGALTMSPLILSCQQQEVTLGLGDVRGLRALY